MDVYVAPGISYASEAKRLSSYLGATYLEVRHKVFPDGERYLRIEGSSRVDGKPVVVVNTMFPNQNDSFIETLMLINAAKKAGASKIVTFIPYLAYARQDKVFLEGEPISAEVVVKAIRNVGGDCLVVVDAHSEKVLRLFGTCTVNLLVFDKLVEKALQHTNNPVIIAPDEGALHRAEYAAKKLGLDYDYLVKHRDRETGSIRIEPKEISVKERDVIIVDDIISTGGTIAEAAKMILSQGARRIVVAASHGLLVGGALEKMRKAGIYRVYLANTLGVKYDDPLIEYVDILDVAANAIRSLLGMG